jgi:hypothetical protein
MIANHQQEEECFRLLALHLCEVLWAAKAAPAQTALLALGAVALLYFARPVVLPVFLAYVAGMTLKRT